MDLTLQPYIQMMIPLQYFSLSSILHVSVLVGYTWVITFCVFF